MVWGLLSLKWCVVWSLNAWTGYLSSCLRSFFTLHSEPFKLPLPKSLPLPATLNIPGTSPHKPSLSSLLNYSFMISRPSINPLQSCLIPDPSEFLFFQYTFSLYMWNKPHSCMWCHLSSLFLKNQLVFDVRIIQGEEGLGGWSLFNK